MLSSCLCQTPLPGLLFLTSVLLRSLLSPPPFRLPPPVSTLLDGSAFPRHTVTPHRFFLLVFYLFKNLVFHAALSLVFLCPLVWLPGPVCIKGSLAVESKNTGRLWSVLASWRSGSSSAPETSHSSQRVFLFLSHNRLCPPSVRNLNPICTKWWSLFITFPNFWRSWHTPTGQYILQYGS